MENEEEHQEFEYIADRLESLGRGQRLIMWAIVIFGMLWSFSKLFPSMYQMFAGG